MEDVNKILENFRKDKGIFIEDFIREHGNEYCWEETDEKSLEDIIDWDNEPSTDLLDFIKEHGTEYSWPETLESLLEDFGDNRTTFSRGDIIMTPFPQATNPHRLVIINKVIKDNNDIIYKGFIMSSKVEKANINNPK